MKTHERLVVVAAIVVAGWVNANPIDVSPENQEELGLKVTVSFSRLSDELVEVSLTAPREGRLKGMSWPAVVFSDGGETLLRAPLAAVEAGGDHYAFAINPIDYGRARLQLPCRDEEGAETLYELRLIDYGRAAGFGRLRSSHNLLAMATGDVRDDFMGIRDLLRDAEVPDAKAAENAAVRHILAHGGLDARDGVEVAGLFRLAPTIEGFAEHYDLVWEVKILRIGALVTDEIWVNARDGKTLAMVSGRSAERRGIEGELQYLR